MKPSLGVLITYFNEKEMLTECLESLFQRGPFPEEVLIYDDASADAATDYVPRKIPARIIRGKVNHGPAHGRNVLLENSEAGYVHFQDSDDLFCENWSEQVREIIKRDQPDIVFTEIASFQEGKQISDHILGLQNFKGGMDLVRFCLEGGMLVPAGTYRREVVKAIGGYRESLHQSEDFDFHIRLAASGATYSVIRDPLIRIRCRPESRSHTEAIEVWKSALKAIGLLSEELKPCYLNDLAEAAARIGSRLFQLKAFQHSHRAFELSRNLGSPRFKHQSGFYRLIARCIGAEGAEWSALFYRTVLPRGIRTRIREYE